MRQMWLIFGGAFAIYVVLAVIMGVLPGFALSSIEPTPGLEPLTPLEAEGRAVYVANGCSYCHTQQVRPLPQDRVWGRPSAPGDFAYQTPELLGSQRTGPDLANVGARQPSATWHYIHLYNPRAVVPESIMPPYAWLFETVDEAPANVPAVPLPAPWAPEHGVVVPTREGEALVAYLLSLKQPPLPGASEAGAGGDASHAAPVGDGSATRTEEQPSEAEETAGDDYRYDPARGESLYVAYCAACHQPGGQGLPGAFPPLKGNAAVNDPDAARHIRVILDGLQGEEIDGVFYGSPMPAFRTSLDDRDIADIVNHERRSWGNAGAFVTAADVAAHRAAAGE